MFRVTVQSGFYWVPKMTRSFYKYFSSGYTFLSNKEKECITQRDEFSKSLYIHLYLLRYRFYFLWFFGMFRYTKNIIVYTFKYYNIYNKSLKYQQRKDKTLCCFSMIRAPILTSAQCSHSNVGLIIRTSTGQYEALTISIHFEIFLSKN